MRAAKQIAFRIYLKKFKLDFIVALLKFRILAHKAFSYVVGGHL